MRVQPAAFLRTTLPLDLSQLESLDSGRYHSIWLPDHMVSFWPDSIWTPEFTDLATVSPSPHRHLDGMAVAAAAAVLTKNVPLVTSVVDTVRRHPAMLAQTRADHRPPRQGPLHPRPRQRRDREHGALRIRLRQAGQPIRGGAARSSGCSGTATARSTSTDSSITCTTLASTPSRIEGKNPADLDRRQRTAHAGDRRPLRRRVVAHRRVDARATTPKSSPP